MLRKRTKIYKEMSKIRLYPKQRKFLLWMCEYFNKADDTYLPFWESEIELCECVLRSGDYDNKKEKDKLNEIRECFLNKFLNEKKL